MNDRPMMLKVENLGPITAGMLKQGSPLEFDITNGKISFFDMGLSGEDMDEEWREPLWMSDLRALVAEGQSLLSALDGMTSDQIDAIPDHETHEVNDMGAVGETAFDHALFNARSLLEQVAKERPRWRFD